MALSWILTDFLTGAVLADLPDVSPQSPVRQTIGQYESNALSMPLSTAPKDWVSLTRPYAANFVALDENNNPVWGGPCTQRPRDESDAITFPVSTLDAYFDRRYISPAISSAIITTPTYGYYADYDQCALAADLVARYAKDGTRPGTPIRIVTTPSAQEGRTQVYSDADDKTVYSGLQDLRNILNGPEWVISWEWSPNGRAITPVLTIADRIGRSPRNGLGPNATFSLPGSVTTISHVEDYTAGKGANDITAVGPGQGNSRNYARQVATNFGGRPTVEFRFNVPVVGNGVTVQQIKALQGYANNALRIMGDGITSVTLTANVTDAPRLGEDWNIGDDIGYEIGGLDSDGNDIVPAFPGGLSGTARVMGVERTDTTVAPIIAIPNPTLTVGSF